MRCELFFIPFLRILLFLQVLLYFGACHGSYYLQQRSDQNYAVNNAAAVDSGLASMLAPYKAGVDTQMQAVIGRTDIPLSKAQPESTLGNFMADAQLAAAKKLDHTVQAAVVNYGGIRLPYVPPGPISRGKLYELMPFDNMITIVEIPGETLRIFCEHMAKAKGWPVSGISYLIKEKTATAIRINGKVLNDHIIYKIAVSDYIAKGGDNCEFLVPLTKKHTNVLVRDAMIDYLEQLEKRGYPLHPELEKRISYAE